MKRIIIFPILFLIFVVYYLTLGRTLLPNGDSGELVTTAFFGGIAHPPGYPLYNLIGYLFLKLSIAGEPAFRLNLMSAILHVFCLFFVYKSFLLLTNNKYFLSILLIFALAFSYSFWLYSGVAEVFSLHNLLFSILFYILLKIFFSKQQNTIVGLSLFWAFVFGLGMSNNHLIVLILPAFIFLLYQKNKKFCFFETTQKKTIIIVKLLLCFVLGLLPYLYFFWARNNVNPMTWIYPENFGDVLRIFFRLNYGDFGNYHDYGFIGLQMNTFVTNIITEAVSFRDDFWLISYFLPIALFFVLFVIYKIKNFRIYLCLLIFPYIFLAMVLKIGLYNYAFSVFERLFLSFHIILISVILMFLSYLVDKIRKRLYSQLLYLILIFLVLFMTTVNYKKANQVNNQICKDYYNDIIRSVPMDSITFVEGDIQTFCFAYHHYVARNSQKDDRFFIFVNYFFEKNDGRFLRKNYNLKLNSMEEFFDLARHGKNNIFYMGGDVPMGLFAEPRGLLFALKKNKSKIDYEEIYRYNRDWFNHSRLLTEYDQSFVNLSSRALYESYCQKYFALAIFFLNSKQIKYAKGIYSDFNNVCQVDDFSSSESMKINLNRLKAKFRSERR